MSSREVGGHYWLQGEVGSSIAEGAIVILVWNRWKDAVVCLEAIEGNLPEGVGVVFVDNCSDENLAIKLKERFSWIHAIRTDRNAGYAGGNNAGAVYAMRKGAKWLYFLNDDTIPESGFVSSAMEGIVSGGFSVVGSVAVFGHDPQLIQEAGVRIDLDTLRVEARKGPRNVVLADGVEAYYSCDAVSGAGFIITRESYELTQGFDESMFMYYEDTDLCFRVQRHGGLVGVANESIIQHFCPPTSRASSNSRLFFYYRFRNYIWFNRRNSSAILRQMLGCCRWILAALKWGAYHRNPALLQYAFKGLYDGWLRLPDLPDDHDGLSAWIEVDGGGCDAQ